MKTYLLIILGILFSAQFILAQNEQVNLLIQSPDGKNVKLVWFLKSWSNDITGFDIKRKEGLQDWVRLNTEPIIPGISMKKKLAIVGVDKNEDNILRARLFKLLTKHKLKETDNSYFQKLSSNYKELEDLMKLMASDYEIALMNGFAYTDHTVTKKTDYQYGLFIQGTDKLLAKASWNYGEIPDLNTVREITSKATIKSSGVQLIWNVDVNKMKTGDVAGFNIYRQGIRLNLTPITSANDKDPSEFIWYDKSANSTVPLQYSISAESIFGIEGIIKPYTYNPADHPVEYKNAEVTEIASSGYYFKDGINIKWIFPKEQERFLKGFFIEKENIPGGYKRVSSLLDPSTRSFNDKSPSPVSVYIRFRVLALYNDRTTSPGIEKIYSYFPINEPPIPQNVKAKCILSDKKNEILITWDPRINGDSVTDYYRVYVYDPVNNKFVPINEDNTVRTNNYTYTVRDAISAQYKFCVSSVSRSGVESSMSDTVTIKY